MRITQHPVLKFDRTEEKKVKFYFNGKEMYGYRGETIASALHAAGVKVLSYSKKHQRPRGFFCAIGNCSSCNMTVNHVPNVRVCVESLQEGMIVESQGGRGKLDV